MTEKHEKRRDALGLFYESVLKPDHELRQCAHNQECFHELMAVSYTHLTLPTTPYV